MADRLANGAPEDGDNRRRVERIVLFIDDLDRCPSEKVMEVLQAVHLLLAYPLFVVVVGVDPRWLLHSLGSTYSAFQADGKRFSANPDSWTTTPQNYLEKIFQIPFNLRPMTEKGYGKLIQRLFSLGETSEPKGPISGPGASAPTPEKSGQAGEVVEKSSEKAPISPAPSPGPDPVPPVDDGRQIPTEEEPDFEVEEESLVIKPWEEKFAEDLFPLIPTPRAAKRFSNTYRILKARVRRESLLQFEGSETIPGDFRVPMLLLAILIGAPGESAKLFPSLQKLAEQGKGGTDALRKFSDQPELKPLEEKIKAIVADTGLDYSSKTFLEWLPRVSRFSFETARALSSN
jgi:hypothetical protein